MKGILAALLGLMGASCAGLVPREPTEPVALDWLVGDGVAGEGRVLVVFLPGRWSRVSEFRREGFGETVQEKLPGADAVAVDLHLGYYYDRSAVVRLRDDVVLPARRAGYEEVWLAGTSLGGLGSLLYAIDGDGTVVERLVLLAPFVGEEAIVEEIEKSGGVAGWRPGEIEEDDYQRKLWAGLKAVSERGGKGFPEVWLGYGESDRLARSNALLGREVLGGRGVTTVEGGHDWAAWRVLFEGFLDRVPGE